MLTTLMTRTMLGMMNAKIQHAMVLWLDFVRALREQHEVKLKIARFKARMTREGLIGCSYVGSISLKCATTIGSS